MTDPGEPADSPSSKNRWFSGDTASAGEQFAVSPSTTYYSEEGQILQNAGWLMASQVVTWLLSSVLAVVLPRYFGAEVAGSFHIAMALWAVVGLVVGFGMNLTLTRSVAQGERSIDELAGSVVAVQVIFHLLGFVGLMIYVNLVGYSSQVVTVVVIIGISQMLFQAGSVFDSVLYGLEQMKALSKIGIVVKTFRTVALVCLVLLGLAFEQVILTLIAAGALALVLSWRALQRAHPFKLRPSRQTAVLMLQQSSPLFLNQIARSLYRHLDVVVISLVASEVVVGWYAAADILFGTLLFIPNVFGAAVFPTLARRFAENQDAGGELTRRSFHLLLVLAVPLGFGVAAVGQQAVDLLYGANFVDSGPVFRIFGIVMALTALNTLLGHHLVAEGRERALTKLMFASFLVAVPVDVALIRWAEGAYENGAIGAAIAYLVTEAIVLGGTILLLRKGTLDASTAWLAIRVVAAASIMLGVVWQLNDVFILIPVMLGVLVYVLLGFAFQVVSPEDRSLVARSLSRKPSSDGSEGVVQTQPNARHNE